MKSVSLTTSSDSLNVFERLLHHFGESGELCAKGEADPAGQSPEDHDRFAM